MVELCMKHFIKGCCAINRNVRISVSFCDEMKMH